VHVLVHVHVHDEPTHAEATDLLFRIVSMLSKMC